MGIVRLKAGHSNSTLLAVQGNRSFSHSNRLQHRRVSVTLLIAPWNPNSPSAELLWIHPRSNAKKPSTSSQETCERFTKETSLNAIGSGNGCLFRWDKLNQWKREQMVFSSLSIVRSYWLWCPCQDISTSLLGLCHRKPLLTQWPTVQLDGLGFSLDFWESSKAKTKNTTSNSAGWMRHTCVCHQCYCVAWCAFSRVGQVDIRSHLESVWILATLPPIQSVSE